MEPRLLVRRVPAILVLLALHFAARPAPACSETPNVLFIAIDDLRPQISCFGAERTATPHLDRLAARGVRFDRAYCNIAVCGASRASLMSGLRPTVRRFTAYASWVERDAPGIPTLATSFRRAGYHTVTNGKVYHNEGDDRAAWSETDWRPEQGGIWWARKPNREVDGGNSHGPAFEAASKPDDRYPDHTTATKTIEDLSRLAALDRPFFLACGFYKPHLPMVAPQAYWDLHPLDQIQLPDNMDFPTGLPKAFRFRSHELRNYQGIPESGPLDEDTGRSLIRAYRACVSFVDAQVGRVLDELDRLGLAERTIIVLWGDHGWQLGEHGFWGKHTNFEVATRIPLVIVAPGVAGGRATSRLVESIDLYPTLCELAGVTPPGHLQGKSLRPLLADVDAAHKDAIFTRIGGDEAVRTERYRYMEARNKAGRGALRGVGLFDLEKDPGENHNVAEDPAYAEVLPRLRDLLVAVRRGE